MLIPEFTGAPSHETVTFPGVRGSPAIHDPGRTAVLITHRETISVTSAGAVIASTRASSAEPGTACHSPALAASTARAWSLSSV